MIILFDLDGTLGNLYGRKDWLEKLTNEEPIYEELEPLVDMEELNIIANKLITSMEKYRWCKKYIPFITEFECQPYGTPKQTNYHNRKCILIDDNAEVRANFETPHRRKTFDANDDIITFLTNLYNDFCTNC